MSEFSFEASTQSFASDVLDASHAVPVAVDFWAPWCAPCRALKPVLEKLADEYGGQFLLAKVNTDEHPEVSTQYGVRGIPTLMIFKNGAVEATKVGAVSKSQLKAFIDSHI